MSPDEWADNLEAEVRRKMFEHSMIAPRGYDSERRRWLLRVQIDTRLDMLAVGYAITVEAETGPEVEHGDPAAVSCGVCGRSRYRNTVGALICACCDGVPVGTAWASLDGLGSE